jgi:hypothetical protein
MAETGKGTPSLQNLSGAGGGSSQNKIFKGELFLGE